MLQTKSISEFRTSLNNRNRKDKYFITFPQWDCSNSDIRQSILHCLPPYKFAISCVETHKDGGKHLHVICCLETRRTPAEFKQWVLSQFSDKEQNKIHIGSVSATKQVIEYMNKEDTDVYTDGTVPKYNSQKKSLTKKQIEMKIMEEQMDARKAWDKYIETEKYVSEVAISHWLREQYIDWVQCEAKCNFYELVDKDMLDNDLGVLNECILQWLQEYVYDDDENSHFDEYLRQFHKKKYADLKW